MEVNVIRPPKTRCQTIGGILVFISIVLPPRLISALGDENWAATFQGPPGVDGETYAAVPADGCFYFGGTFSTVGGGNVAASNIARWDGSMWSAMGAGVDGPVYALAADGGVVFAGGSFTNASGVLSRGIARWDGDSWSGVGGGVDGTVRAIAFTRDAVYVGGAFTNAGGVLVNNIAKWDASGWSALGTGIRGKVYAIAVKDDDIYVGGAFTNAGGVSANHVAAWDGVSWRTFGSGLGATPSPNNAPSVRSISLGAANSFYVGGTFRTAGNTNANYIAFWTGTSWTSLGANSHFPMADENGVNGSVFSLLSVGEDLYVGGGFSSASTSLFTGINAGNIARWSDGTWSRLGTSATNGVNGFVNCLTYHGDTLMVGGRFQTASGVSASRVAEWSDGSWRSLGESLQLNPNGQIYSIVRKGADLFFGGFFTRIGGINATNIARWDGTNWHPLGQGISAGFSTTVRAMVVDGEDLFVGGDFKKAGLTNANSIARWDGANWYPLGEGVGGNTPYVNTLEVVNGKLYAGGSFTRIGTSVLNVSRIACWDGTEWSRLSDGVDSDVYALETDGTNLFVGGSFGRTSGLQIPHLAIWSGTNWSGYPQLRNSVTALHYDGSRLYAGGLGFRNTDAKYFVYWDGTFWQPVGNSGSDAPNDVVTAIVPFGQSLIVAGSFTKIGNLDVSFIAEWTGTSWNSLGSGLNNLVRCLLADGDDLWAGGAFRRAGAKGSFYLARWNEQTTPGLPVLFVSSSATNCVLSWPEWAMDYSLQIAPSPATTHWADVFTGGRNIFTNASLAGDAFFRLRKIE